MTTDSKRAPRAALYLRISKKPAGTSRSAEAHDSDTSYSVDDQRVRCDAVCAASGYEVGPVFYDDGISAYRSLKDRPGYGELGEAISSRAFDVLVFDRQDRLQRDQRETMKFIIKCGEAGVAWHSAQEGTIDLDDTMSVMFAIFRGGEAQAYSDKISKNQSAANTRKRDLGLPGAGGRPFGYEADKITIRADEAELVRRGTEMVLSGAPRRQVLALFRESGIKSVRGSEWHIASVVAVLRRWRNAGWVEHDDAPHVEAVWPAIVTLEDVENARTILSQGRVPGVWKKPTMLCSGIAHCACELSLVVTNNDGVPAYRCSGIVRNGTNGAGTHVTIRAELLDSAVRAGVLDAYFAKPANNTAGKAEAEALARLYARRDDARRERARVQSDRKAGIYTQAEAAHEVAAIEKQIAKIDTDITDTASRSAHAAMLAELRDQLWAAVDAEPDSMSPVVDVHPDRSATTIPSRYSRAVKDDPIVREALLKRFDAMPLEQRRSLVRSLVRVTVAPGRGTDRVAVEPI